VDFQYGANPGHNSWSVAAAGAEVGTGAEAGTAAGADLLGIGVHYLFRSIYYFGTDDQLRIRGPIACKV